MSLDRPVAGAGTRSPVLADALGRHLEWARDFAVAGDVDLAVDALRDAHAIVGELHESDALRDAGEHQFADLLPSPPALRQIESLNHALRAEPIPALTRDRGMARRLSQTLNELSAWATGVRLAYETLEDDAGGDA